MPELIDRKTAIALGLKRYFTGKPCKHGHVAERDWQGACIVCSRLRDRVEYRRSFYKEHREEALAAAKKNYWKHKERARVAREIAAEAIWRDKNPDKPMPELMNYRTARALGLKRYFTGKPCPCGHVAERYVSCQHCVPCINNRDRKGYQRNYYKTHREKLVVSAAIWRERNPDKLYLYNKTQSERRKIALRFVKEVGIKLEVPNAD